MNFEFLYKVLPILISLAALFFAMYSFNKRNRYLESDFEIGFAESFTHNAKIHQPLSYIILGVPKFESENLIIFIPISIKNKSNLNALRNLRLYITSNAENILTEIDKENLKPYRTNENLTRLTTEIYESFGNKKQTEVTFDIITPKSTVEYPFMLKIPKTQLEKIYKDKTNILTSNLNPLEISLEISCTPEEIQLKQKTLKLLFVQSDSIDELTENSTLWFKNYFRIKEPSWLLELKNGTNIIVPEAKRREMNRLSLISYVYLQIFKYKEKDKNFAFHIFEKTTSAIGNMSMLVPPLANSLDKYFSLHWVLCKLGRRK